VDCLSRRKDSFEGWQKMTLFETELEILEHKGTGPGLLEIKKKIPTKTNISRPTILYGYVVV
jgi:hypothetical protein